MAKQTQEQILKDQQRFIQSTQAQQRFLPTETGTATLQQENTPFDSNSVNNKKFKNNGRKGKVSSKQVEEALDILQKYRDGIRPLHEKIKSNIEWWRQRHWALMKNKQVSEGSKKIEQVIREPEPTTAHMFNCIRNKHADAMDNYPELVFLPVAKDDEETCEILNKIMPTIFERNHFRKTYSKCWDDKLISGTGIYGVFWNPQSYFGMGDVEFKKIDPLRLFYKPEIEDIQESPHTFYVTEVPKETAEEEWPFLKEKLTTGNSLALTQHNKSETDVEDSYVEVVDWYYKKNGKLHYCKFCSGEVIYASENDEKFKNTGYYVHGKHPFVFDVMYPQPKTPCGFGLIDVHRPSQELIDKYTQLTLMNVKVNAISRHMVDKSAGINLEDFNDFNKRYVEVPNLNENTVVPIQEKDNTGNYVALINNKVNEMNEVSGNRDFTQGGTVAGITSGSAIAALQESGSKQSRDSNITTYDAMSEIGEMTIDIMRQFYQNSRFFRIAGQDTEFDYTDFNNERLLPQKISDNTAENGFRYHMPIFDIKIKAQKKSPFSTVANNEMFLNFFKAGFFNPELSDQSLALNELLVYEGKEKVSQKLRENGTLLQIVQQQNQQLQQQQYLLQLIQNTPRGYMLLQHAMAAAQQMPTEQMNMNTKREGDPNSSVPLRTDNLGNTQAVHDWQAKQAAEQAKAVTGQG